MKFTSDYGDVEIVAPFGTVIIKDERFRNIDEALRNIDRLRKSAEDLHAFVMKTDAGYAEEITRVKMDAAYREWRSLSESKLRPGTPEQIAEALNTLNAARAAYVAAGGTLRE